MHFKARAQQWPSATLGVDINTFATVLPLRPQPAAFGSPGPSHSTGGDRAGIQGDGSLTAGRATAVGNKDTQPAANWTDSLIALSLRTSQACCPPQEQPAAHHFCLHPPVGGRGWAAQEGGWQGTPVRLDDPLEQKGKTLAGDVLAVSAHREEHLKNSSSAVKSSQKQKLLLPFLPAPHQAEPSTIHPTKHHQCDEHMAASSSLSPSLFLARG